jgi:hypothetical protein
MTAPLLLLAIVMTIVFAYFAFTGRLKAYPGKSIWISVSLFFLWVCLLIHYVPLFLHKR